MEDFAEDLLPRDQPVIVTSNVTALMVFATMLLDANRRYAGIATLTSKAGTGKSIAGHYYYSQLIRRSGNCLPAVAKIKVKPRSTAKALAVDLVQSLHERPKGHNVYQLGDEAAAAIVRNGVELGIIDEADWLTDESFDLLRRIHDKSGCSFLLLGLPHLLSVIDGQDKFSSRVALRMKFEPLSLDEIHEVVLPQMVFPHWKYSAGSRTDRELGKYIWSIVNPSLRNLRNLLQAADLLAAYHREDRITRETINDALGWTANAMENARINELEKERNTSSTHEEDSQRRQAAKERASET